MEFLDRKSKRGRPVFKVTQRLRHQVSIGAAAGLTECEVATVIGISRATLRVHFADELRSGRARALVQNLVRLDRAAARGSTSAAKFLVGVFSNGAPALGGKKARAEAAAKVAGAGTEWGELLQV